jgi:cellulose synthase/poly-beta-1,6-N-acetylglucosamine synthase-like glycosyltransferase
MIAAAIVFWCAIGTLLYMFVGYPLILGVLGILVRKRPRFGSLTQPTVSLIVSAYNEEKVIGEKLENCLSLQYPPDKLEIIVVSDASTDRTDAIVEGYAYEGVVLKRMPMRGGKTAGLNAVMPLTTGEIIVFSDANALYVPNAVQQLVKNFSDPSIGCVTGDSRYDQLDASYVGKSEDTYWDYERFLKIKESALGSMVGADGAIFAIRKRLFRPLKAEDINDFVIPLQIVSQGFRCVFEPEAVCYESAVVHFEGEFRRKVRIANRCWNGLFRVKQLLNPFRYGWFSLQLISHKLLRWLTPVFLMSLLASSVFLASENWMCAVYAGVVIGQLVLYALGMLGLGLERLQIQSRWLSLACYFTLMNVASVVGMLKYIRGQKINIWEPEREGRYRVAKHRATPMRWGGLLGFGGMLLTVTILWPKPLFWAAWGVIVYTYIGYPIWAMILRGFAPQPWRKEDYEPAVTLLIVAHNERESIETKLENSLALDYPQDRLAIVVASDGSSDGTNAIVCQYEEKGVLGYYFPERAGKMSAINRILPEVQTDIVVLSDANVIYAPDAIRKLVRNFADDDVGAVSGRVTLISDMPVPGIPERLYYRYEWFVQQLESQTGSLVGVDGAMYGIRRDLFQPMPDHVVLDDFIIAMNIAKQGKRVVYEPEAKAHEASAASLKVEFQRKIRLVAGAVQSLLRGEGVPQFRHQPLLFLKYFSHKALRWGTPVFLAVSLVANLCLLDELWYLGIFAGQMMFCTAAFMGTLQRSPSRCFAIALYVCSMSIAASFGFVRGVLNQQNKVWDRLERARIP